jgi:hypothetical protein
MLFGKQGSMMSKILKGLLPMLLLPMFVQAQRGEDLKRVYFNMYTDSIKTILHYYVNVEGEYHNGRFLPLDTNSVVITADNGTMVGNDWIAPRQITFEKVTFRVASKTNSRLRDEVTVWLKRAKDPRDEMGAEEMDLPYPGSERKGRRR